MIWPDRHGSAKEDTVAQGGKHEALPKRRGGPYVENVPAILVAKPVDTFLGTLMFS